MSGTRRTVLAGLGACALPAPVVSAKLPRPVNETEARKWRAFIEGMSHFRAGPNGRYAALHAFEAGMSLSDLTCVLLVGPASLAEDFPRLMFETPEGSPVFTPSGRLF